MTRRRMRYFGTHRSAEPRTIVLLSKGFLAVTAMGMLILAPVAYVSICILSMGTDALRVPAPSPLPTIERVVP